MKKKVKVYPDKKKFLVEGNLDMELNNHGKPEVYELDIKDEDFREFMKNPEKIPLDKIKNKRKIKE